MKAIKTPDTTNLFSSKSEAYALYRPGYSGETISRLLDGIPLTSDLTAVDVGAGTGIASLQLAEHGLRVIGIEPDSSMIDRARQHSRIEYRRGSAELLPLLDDEADVLTTFQAFHWFDTTRSLREFRRVLKPGGRLAIVWSYWDPSDPFTGQYMRLIGEAAAQNENRVDPYGSFPSGFIKNIRIKMLWKLRRLPYFKKVQRHRSYFKQQLTLEGLIGCARSQSYVKHEGEEWDRLVADIERLQKRYPDHPLCYNINLFIATPDK